MRTTTMKTTKLLIVFTIAAVFFLSCDTPISLGAKLDLDGPVVDFTAPFPRKSVPLSFVIEGNAADKSGVARLLLTAELNRELFAKQWRYINGSWEVSEDFGASWLPLEGAAWEGSSTSALWSLTIDMTINGAAPPDGEYLFMVQAWDSGNFTDDNSFKTLVLIVDRNPPKVTVVDPNLYSRLTPYDPLTDTFTGNPDLQALHALPDSPTDKSQSRNPANIGKFVTRAFDLKWQIDDEYDIWSIDLMFCQLNTDVDGLPETDIDMSKVFYRYHENLGAPPATPDPGSNIKPNGTAKVPALTNAAGTHPDKDGEIINPVPGKTTIKVVAICYDAAGHPNDEKTLGYFIYWPMADEPWVTYNGKMPTNLPAYLGQDINTTLFNNVFSIYPKESVNATAYQAHGVSKIVYTLIKCSSDENDKLTLPPEGEETSGPYELHNTPRDFNGRAIFSTSFPWEFTPPNRPGYYVVNATVFDADGYGGNEVFPALFKVEDISFPNFPTPPQPPASEPLFKFITSNSITISGEVADATGLDSLLMVWINPSSNEYSAMSQLEYFRDPGYDGWKLGKSFATVGGTPVTEGYFDSTPGHENKIWKIGFTLDTDKTAAHPDNRQIYNYSKTINLGDLNIGTAANQNWLKSQIFLLRAENTKEKSTIITYAPQGDTGVPKIEITKVNVSTQPNDYTPDQTFTQIAKIEGGEKITVTGTWTEDSTEFLESQPYFYTNMHFTINDIPITGATGTNTTVTINPVSNAAATNGTFTITADVGTGGTGYALQAADLKDTLVVNASVTDFGGNTAEHGASWLIASDNLRFLRISSISEDRAHRAGEQIKIYIEFNKPVILKPNRSRNPVLLVNATGANTTTGIATYDNSQVTTPTESTRHYFTYTVGAGHNTDRLNVTGISIVQDNTPLAVDATAWQTAGYPFTFVHTNIDGGTEEIRLTRTTAHVQTTDRNGVLISSTPRPDNSAIKDDVWARLVPVDATNNASNRDYIYTLAGGKVISVDNTPPTITGITASPQGWHPAGTDIYITATFNEPVRLGSALPRLTLLLSNSPATQQTSLDNANDIRVNNNQITFRYVAAGNAYSTVQVNGFSGAILDTAGNEMPETPFTTRTLTGVFIDTNPPIPPTIAVFSGTIASPGPQITTPTGTLYDEKLFIRITGSSGPENLGRVEYSLNNGLNWTSSTTAVTNIEVTNSGLCEVITRQTDQAGNVSPLSPTTTFTWDPGSLISRISSTSANGTYTHMSGRNLIPITVYFRKSINITATSGITLNALRGAGNGTPIVVTVTNVTLPQNNVNSLTFNYTVQNENPSGSNNGDRMPAGVEWLDVTNLGITATETNNVSINASYLTGTSALPTAAGTRLAENKQIKVVTGSLSDPNPTFTNDMAWGSTTETDSNYQGIRTDDGSYWTTLQIQFNHEISKGSGNITIEQIAGSGDTAYRLPTVLTETQYNRFRGIANFNDYYTKGTNGYIDGQGSDTSTKYVLNYINNPNSGRGNTAVFTGDVLPATAFFTAFRQAERITLNVNSQSVVVEGNTLKVRLTGSNAPQVPGATYNVTYPEGLVIDILDNPSFARTDTPVTLDGVAKPFVRIKKTQDIIGTRQTSSATTPTLTATQPQYAYVRMDSRTPGSSIAYWTSSQSYTTNSSNWNGSNTANPGPVNPNTPAATRPNLTVASTTYVPQPAPAATNQYGIRIGADTYGGYKWWVVARASKNNVNSSYSDEMAYRTAITYRLQGMRILETTGQQVIGNGMQIWIRGGDSLGSSSIPGFPFTWEDNWTNLNTTQKRAGIRLMTKTAANDQLINSTWQFMTWDINAIAYVDFVLGLDNGQTINEYAFTASDSLQEVWQYGPKYFSLQRAGWAPSKSLYPVYPGEIRYLDTGTNFPGAGDAAPAPQMNFSAAFNTRGAQTATITNANTNN